MEEEAQATIECGFCLRKDGGLPEPKAMPCTHVHCLPCLNGYYEENRMLICPVSQCGKVFIGSPDSLPSHDLGEDNSKWCDVCVKKKMTKEEAVSYCGFCSKMLCERHKQSHDDTMSDHPNISIQEYIEKAARMQSRNCTTHKEHPYTMGCKLCNKLCCVQCLTDLGSCDNTSSGTAHSLLPLDKLVAALMEDNISADMIAKEEQYEKLFKQTSKLRAEYDKETNDMIQLIHKTRDVQVNALVLKYQNVEDQVMEKRQRSRLDMAEFMEEIVLKKWTRLRNQRKLLETRLKHSHQVDIVEGFGAMKEKIQKLIEVELPTLELTNELQLKKLGESTEIELETAAGSNVVIGSIHGVVYHQPIPMSMTLLKSVKLPAWPISVCHYNNCTYVGLYNKTVSRIDNNYQLYNSFITTFGTVESLSMYNGRFYTLSRTNPRTVGVYDTSGGHITSWSHPYHSYYCNMLTVVADQVVVADPPNQRITVYSLTGESLRHIPCPLLTDTIITVCALDSTSVVISNYDTSKVFRANICTGEVMWTLSDVRQPQGMTRYGSHILLAAYKNKTIYILDSTTGDIVSDKLVDDSIDGSYIYSLGVDGTTPLVPSRDANQLLYYQLNTEGKSG